MLSNLSTGGSGAGGNGGLARRSKSIRNLKNVFGMSSMVGNNNNSSSSSIYGAAQSGYPVAASGRDEWDLQHRQSDVLYSLQLPPSIPSLERMSPELWSWVHASDIRNQGSHEFAPFHSALHSANRALPITTRVFSPAGEQLEIPKHLTGSTLPTSSSTGSFQSGAYTLCGAADDSHDVSDAIESGSPPSSSPSNYSGGLTRKPVPTLSDLPTSYSHGALPALPTQERQKIKRFFLQSDGVIGVVSAGSLRRCTSVLPLSMDTLGPKGFQIATHPMEGFLFDIPETQQDFTITIRVYSKAVFSETSITTSKKEAAQINLQMGLFIDEEYWPEPIWKKYYVVGSFEGVKVLDMEYREDIEAVAWLPFSQIVGLDQANPEFMAAPNCMRLTILLPWKSDENTLSASASAEWRRSVIAAADVLTPRFATIYITGDDAERTQAWREYLTCPRPTPRR
eukprot:jgi/Hompol1/5186/HPOL_004206-RA